VSEQEEANLGSSQKVHRSRITLQDAVKLASKGEETMKKRLISGLLALALFACITQGTAAKELPMKGSGSGIITSLTPGPNGVEITAVGTGDATYLGKFTREENILLDPNNGTVTGTIVFTAADGSELNCDLAGAFTGANTLAGTYTFTGGTGRFENASGVAYFSIVQSDPANFTFAFAGTIDLN
jgi:hypothetical protein